VSVPVFPIDRYQGIAACGRADRAIEPRGAEPVKEAAIHGSVAEQTDRAGVGIRQDGLRPILLANEPQPFRYEVEGLVPADALEDVSLAAVWHSPFRRPLSAAHGVEQPRGRIDAIQILGDLAAEKAAGDRCAGRLALVWPSPTRPPSPERRRNPDSHASIRYGRFSAQA